MSYEYNVPFVDFITSFGENDGADKFFDVNTELEKLSIKEGSASKEKECTGKNDRLILQEVSANIQNIGSTQSQTRDLQILPASNHSVKSVKKSEIKLGPENLKNQISHGFSKPASALRHKKHFQIVEEVNGELYIKNDEIRHAGVPRTIPSQRTKTLQHRSFEERQKLQVRKREDHIKKVLEEEKKKRVFHANPIPNYLKSTQQKSTTGKTSAVKYTLEVQKSSCATGKKATCATGKKATCATGKKATCATGKKATCATGKKATCATRKIATCATEKIATCATEKIATCATEKKATCATEKKATCATEKKATCATEKKATCSTVKKATCATGKKATCSTAKKATCSPGKKTTCATGKIATSATGKTAVKSTSSKPAAPQANSSSQNSTTSTFRARPAFVIQKQPFLPRRTERSLVKPGNVTLHSEERAKARREFDEKLRQHYKELEDEARAKKEQEVKREKEEIAELRKRLVHKAQPVPLFKSALHGNCSGSRPKISKDLDRLKK